MTPIHSSGGLSVVRHVLATAGVVALTLTLGSFPSTATSAELWIGAATADITPEPAHRSGRRERGHRDSKPLHGQRAGLGVAAGRSGARPGDPGLLRLVHLARHPRGIPQAPGRPAARLRRQQALPGRHPHPYGDDGAQEPIRREGLRRRRCSRRTTCRFCTSGWPRRS